MNEITSTSFLESIAAKDVAGIRVLDLIEDHVNQFSKLEQRSIEDCEFSTLIFPKYSFQSLTLSRCRFEQLVLRSQQNRYVLIKNCVISDLTIEQGFSTGKLTVEDCRISNAIRLSKFAISEINIIRTSFNDLDVDGIGSSNLNLEHAGSVSGIDGSVILHGGNGSLNFKKVSVGSLKIFGSIHTISLEQCTLKTIYGENASIADLLLRESEVKECSIVQGSTSCSLYGSHINILNLSCNVPAFHCESYEGKSCILGSIDLSKALMVNRVTISNSRITIINLSGLKDLNRFYIDDVVINELLNFERATIEDGRIYNLDISNAEVRCIYANLTGSIFTNVQWPRNYELYEYDAEQRGMQFVDRRKLLLAIKEAYRQLKVLSAEQSNRIDALYFQKHELKLHWHLTRLKTANESFLANIGNWFILATNRLFSDFGQNIWRPLLFLAGFHCFWFGLLLWFKFGICSLFCGADWTLTGDALNAYFSTILPTHSTTLSIGLMKDVYIGGSVDFFMRVFSSYFIFYFIYSSRKYHQ